MATAIAAMLAFAVAVGFAPACLADALTCPVRPALAACSAPLPGPGVSFSGPVLQVIDGRTRCVALGPLPTQWIHVELADGDVDGLRGALMAVAFAENVECTATEENGLGVVAVCLLDGASISGLARAPAIRARAADWR